MIDTDALNRQPLGTLMLHHVWANLRILAACQQLSADHFDATLPGTFGTIRTTLAHLVESEYGYLRLLGLPASLPTTGPVDQLTLDQLEVLLTQSGAQLVDLAQSGASAAAYAVTAHGTTWQVPLGFLLAQVVNHATEHRTNITTIMSSLGIDAPETSPWMYFLALHAAPGSAP